MIAQAGFDPYILQQASCRASLLVASAGLSRDDWEDLRQEMVLDCLERTPRFDPQRGDWRAFVRGVIRNHSTVLASRELKRVRCESLPSASGGADGDGDPDGEGGLAVPEPASEDPTGALTLSADVQRVIESLPENLRTLAFELMELTVAEVATKRGRSTQWIYQLVKRLRQAFIRAGVTPSSYGRNGGGR